MKTSIAIPAIPLCLPLLRRLEGRDSISVVPGTTDAVARMLRQRQADVAFVSPMEYARESSEYRILPGYCPSSLSGVKLSFRKQLRTIRSLAADPSRTSEIVLAQIILREEFESHPPIVPMINASIEAMLKKADAALWLPGQDELSPVLRSDSIDLVETWRDMVQLPYVHGVLCAREGLPASDGLSYLMGDHPVDDLSRLRSSFAESPEMLQLLDSCRFTLGETEREGLSEFLRYAHYHGMIRDIPSVRTYSIPDPLNNN